MLIERVTEVSVYQVTHEKVRHQENLPLGRSMMKMKGVGNVRSRGSRVGRAAAWEAQRGDHQEGC